MIQDKKIDISMNHACDLIDQVMNDMAIYNTIRTLPVESAVLLVDSMFIYSDEQIKVFKERMEG